MSALDTKPGPSDYLDDALYARLHHEHCRDRDQPDADECLEPIRALLAYEARLLDECRFEDWLDLFSQDCVYWVPSAWPPTDPTATVSITLDDRRRLEDRIARYRTGFAFSQLPLSRISRTLSQLECWWLDEPNAVIVRTPFHLSELRRGEVNIYAGHYEHVISAPLDAPLIAQKRVHLLMADQPAKNISFIF